MRTYISKYRIDKTLKCIHNVYILLIMKRNGGVEMILNPPFYCCTDGEIGWTILEKN